jgi:hypothetical protein
LTIEVGEFGEVLSDEAVYALNLLQETPVAETCCHLSVDAVAGTDTVNTVRIQASVGDQAMILLVDSGSSNSFVNRRFAERAGCIITPAPPVSVKVANGQLMLSDSQVTELQWSYKDTLLLTQCAFWKLGLMTLFWEKIGWIDAGLCSVIGNRKSCSLSAMASRSP